MTILYENADLHYFLFLTISFSLSLTAAVYSRVMILGCLSCICLHLLNAALVYVIYVRLMNKQLVYKLFI